MDTNKTSKHTPPCKRRRRLSRRGQSAIEFAALVIFVLFAFWVFQKYIARGLYGRWKGVGDAIGQGRIYDPNLTTECEFYPGVGWYDRICYENLRDGYGDCYTPSDCNQKHGGMLASCRSAKCTN